MCYSIYSNAITPGSRQNVFRLKGGFTVEGLLVHTVGHIKLSLRFTEHVQQFDKFSNGQRVKM